MSRDYRYRVTKQDFERVVKDISNMLGVQLYLVPASIYMFLTPVNHCIECQSKHYLCLSNHYSYANYDKLIAFEKGVMAVLNIR